MKNIYIISLLICLALFVGCNKDTSIEEYVDTSCVVITMNIYNDSSQTRSESTYSIQEGVLGTAEYVIDRLRVYVFASDGSLDKMEYYDGLNANHLVNQEIEVPKDLSKEMYFVANEPTTLSDKLALVSSTSELEDIDFTIAYAMNTGFNAAATFSSEDFLIPMSAQYSVLNATVDLNIYVGLTRSVARVDLYLNKDDSAASREVKLDSKTTLTASGVTDQVDLFEGTISSVSSSDVDSREVVSSAVTLSTNSWQRVLSFYLAERTYDYENDDTKITITVDGLIEGSESLGAKSVTLGEEGDLTQIKRNYVYQIYGTYYTEEDEIVTNTFKIVDWEDVEIDAEIEGVMVAVDSEVAMDWLRNGNSYSSESISFGSNKAISFYLPVSTSSSDDPTPDYEFKLFEFEEMSAGQSYDLLKIDLTNNYIFATTWIESATIHFTSDRSGYIEFVYTPKKVNYKIQSYPIRIKSDNVVKQMKAVYDNGYFPASLLSDDWASRAPGGVVFAKRGYAKHPVTTPEIFYRDEDGYYRGEHSATAEVGTQYCIEQFGDDWYMPSYSDIQEIAALYDMLGVSYRFQNNGSAEDSDQLTASSYWTSTASISSPGYYWSADFMSRVYMVDNLLTRYSADQIHFVRCVMDLQ